MREKKNSKKKLYNSERNGGSSIAKGQPTINGHALRRRQQKSGERKKIWDKDNQLMAV
jgi:hypothetical protein